MPISAPLNYDKTPHIPVPGHECHTGWNAIARALTAAAGKNAVIAVECYPGVDDTLVAASLSDHLDPSLVLRSADALLPESGINSLIAPFLGGNDPVFGFLSDLTLDAFFAPDRLAGLSRQLAEAPGLKLVVGCGAALVAPNADLTVYADLARWEAQLRFRRNQSANLGASDPTHPANLQYKRAFFIDWRVADRFKLPILRTCGFVLDTHHADAPKLVAGDAVRGGLRLAARRPFRVVPFFDPAPWGGQWMKEVCDLDRTAANYGWCFDCVPEENSLLLEIGGELIEIPSINLVLDQPDALLGESVHRRFGAEFPIRFDFLDTMGGGNLSFQVHPLTSYIREHFGMAYTQDESYYILDAGPSASVYLGLKDGVDRNSMLEDLAAAQSGDRPFPADAYANRFPAAKHDHFLIPAGTVHCSGAESMVLEISATPYIFTFKLWDWNRLGLDGKPRPIHLTHGTANIQWDRTTAWTRENLVNRTEPVTEGDGWREERTGLHDLEFIETRRHWFTGTVPHDTCGNLNVLNLVEGREAVVESPTGAFDPFVVHYAETFIIPAAVGPYTIRPHGEATGTTCATLKAFVRPD